MKMLDRLNGPSGIKIMFGSGCFWAWFDALFMSAFFRGSSPHSTMPEACAMLTFALSVPFLVLAFFRSGSAKRLLGNKRNLITLSTIGTAGSVLVVLAGFLNNWALLVVGTLLSGMFMATLSLSWGAVYCHEGARTATPYVAGGFACAIIIDAPLLLMIPAASAFFFALLPLVSGILMIAIPEKQRTYPSGQVPAVHPLKNSRSRLKNYLGLSFMLMGGMILVMVGFGYVQHLISFISIAGSNQTDGISIQVARGIIALGLFIVIVIARKNASPVFRIGLLAMVAGFTMMPFLFHSDFFWIAGVLIIGGYTIFDLLVWISFSQVAYAQSHDPLKTIAVMRIIVSVCFVLGAAMGIFLAGTNGEPHEFATAETAFVGYLVVIATVLLLSSEDVWTLSRNPRTPSQRVRVDDKGPERDDSPEQWFDTFELTSREKEVALLLTYGRTKSWIAQSLGISENTVISHVRHIYQKAEVHNRQEFIDLVLSDVSPGSCDR